MQDKLIKSSRIVMKFDICSSTDILEDLIRTENISGWRDFLIEIGNYLEKKSRKLNFELYNFTGDGWIILFDSEFSGANLMDFTEALCNFFHKKFEKIIAKVLETPPELIGLTFGIDRGTLIQIVMKGKKEYVGRAINVACRLQGAIRDKDSNPQYKILMTKNLYNYMQNDLKNCRYGEAHRTLRNIANGKKIRCVKVWLPMAQGAYQSK